MPSVWTVPRVILFVIFAMNAFRRFRQLK
ncbi:hypothetical protein AAHA92_29377 [Salvia divinorum]|uniref:Uncharacterized protein n=1 Tax=Salvia divinorum TaxID=28513 RepID=A0ABD1G149_SALDI